MGNYMPGVKVRGEMFAEFDVAVIGASLSGSSAAVRLGQTGLRVALIDKATFPRRKPCGEGLSAFGLEQFTALGIRQSILELPHLKYFGYRLKSGSARSLVKSPWEGNITIQRELLDARVLSHALEFSTVTPFLGRPVTAIAQNSVAIGDLKLSAKNIIVASGSNSSLLKNLPCKTCRYGPSRSGISATFKGSFSSEPKYIAILLKKDFEVYCTPLAGGRLNVSILTRAKFGCDLRENILAPDLLREAFEECSFRGELELAPQGRANIGNIRRSCASPSIWLVGDAKEEFDPIGGMGMSHALSSGIEAATSIINRRTRTDSSRYFAGDQLPSTSAMRRFTAVSYQTLMHAKRFPLLLSIAASSIGRSTLAYLTKELA